MALFVYMYMMKCFMMCVCSGVCVHMMNCFVVYYCLFSVCLQQFFPREYVAQLFALLFACGQSRVSFFLPCVCICLLTHVLRGCLVDWFVMGMQSSRLGGGGSLPPTYPGGSSVSSPARSEGGLFSIPPTHSQVPPSECLPSLSHACARTHTHVLLNVRILTIHTYSPTRLCCQVRSPSDPTQTCFAHTHFIRTHVSSKQ